MVPTNEANVRDGQGSPLVPRLTSSGPTPAVYSARSGGPAHVRVGLTGGPRVGPPTGRPALRRASGLTAGNANARPPPPGRQRTYAEAAQSGRDSARLLSDLAHAAGRQPAVHRSAPWRFVHDPRPHDRAEACEIEPARVGNERPPCAQTTAYGTGARTVSPPPKRNHDIVGRPELSAS